VLNRRRAGALLHMTSLQAALGAAGRNFVDWLAEAGFSVWQFLPVGPTGPSGSPYWVRSDSAGNVALIDPHEQPPADTPEYQAFLAASQDWLEDYACFEVLSSLHAGSPWWSWAEGYRDRQPAALAQLRREQAAALDEVKRGQFVFAWQWQRLHSHARARGVLLFGDLPFYVAPDSVETWAHREQFQLDKSGRALAVAGVPPDYFSDHGQLWGNPLYEWDVMVEDRFSFWRTRIGRLLARVDLLRLDHFRALAAHWAVPASAPDARSGSWRRTPGRALLSVLNEEFTGLPLVAEDLGIITPDVVDLRRGFELPGMRVLQFAFDGDGLNQHLPHMHERDCVVYTGTHDNDTTLGWYTSLDAESARRVDFMLQLTPGAMPEALIRATLGSVGTLAVLPVQDVLGLGSQARFNTPATTQGNWGWRLAPGALTAELAAHYLRMNRAYGRC